MSLPNFPSDGQGERTDALVNASNAATFKLGVGSVTPTGGTTNAAWAGAATHAAASAVGGSDGVSVAAGKNAAGNAAPLTVEDSGGITAGQSTRATYTASVADVAATSATEILVIEAPSGAAVRLARLTIWNVGAQTTPGLVDLELLRTTTAGTGGTITPAPLDTADTYGGIVRAGPTAGTESTVLYHIPVWVPSTTAAMAPIIIEWSGISQAKAPTIAAGVTHGIALKHPGSDGAASLAVTIEFVVG